MVGHNGVAILRSLRGAFDEFREVKSALIKEVVVTAHGELVAGSPADTGRYRASHFISKGAPSASVPSPGEYSMEQAMSMSGDVEGDEGSYHISTNVEYAEHLEATHPTKKLLYERTAKKMERKIESETMKLSRDFRKTI